MSAVLGLPHLHHGQLYLRVTSVSQQAHQTVDSPCYQTGQTVRFTFLKQFLFFFNAELSNQPLFPQSSPDSTEPLDLESLSAHFDKFAS